MLFPTSGSTAIIFLPCFTTSFVSLDSLCLHLPLSSSIHYLHLDMGWINLFYLSHQNTLHIYMTVKLISLKYHFVNIDNFPLWLGHSFSTDGHNTIGVLSVSISGALCYPPVWDSWTSNSQRMHFKFQLLFIATQPTLSISSFSLLLPGCFFKDVCFSMCAMDWRNLALMICKIVSKSWSSIRDVGYT